MSEKDRKQIESNCRRMMRRAESYNPNINYVGYDNEDEELVVMIKDSNPVVIPIPISIMKEKIL